MFGASVIGKIFAQVSQPNMPIRLLINRCLQKKLAALSSEYHIKISYQFPFYDVTEILNDDDKDIIIPEFFKVQVLTKGGTPWGK